MPLPVWVTAPGISLAPTPSCKWLLASIRAEMWLSKPIVCSRVYDWRWKQAKLIYKSYRIFVRFRFGMSVAPSVCQFVSQKSTHKERERERERERAFWTTQRHACCRFLGGQLQPSAAISFALHFQLALGNQVLTLAQSRFRSAAMAEYVPRSQSETNRLVSQSIHKRIEPNPHFPSSSQRSLMGWLNFKRKLMLWKTFT